ncbi:hypothetical protein [Riemerella anatipestifer]|uniref:hypothetical protein n=1 Tax=Riemerella anatipestifer TaxID=34085 RepID=UPI001BDB01F7|nr:hypothetical protein [Riemerella anatipestifer]MBT0554303.1 hypothetical protein [Riemerella anatipestifer]MCE3024960.1 hypothetical protein [Riemerella anatipestifer]MDY3449853.1 hypothetical protein [Riemerella anatipestifer]QYR03330.1 hypothetical protein J6M00_02610 [Riemerella anatipestifer]QYR05599.1 hypothetical protein J6M09_02850 [Riemerella anatipestifer]
MKKALLGFLACVCLFVSCSKDREETGSTNPYTKESYIKNLMIGKWKFWGHKSGSIWVDSGEVYIYYLTFNDDNTFRYQNINKYAPEDYNGKYMITPATDTDNAYIILIPNDNKKYRSRKMVLLDYDNGKVTTYDDYSYSGRDWLEKWEKITTN